MIADPVDALLRIRLPLRIIGENLFHQFQLHQVFQINADLGPGEFRVQIQVIQLTPPCRDGCKNRIVDSGFPQFFLHNPLPLLIEIGVCVKNMPADIVFDA